MNNQAAQTMPPWVQERELIRAALCKELDTNIESDERTYTIAVRAANALHWRQIEIDQLKAQVAALSQTAGVPSWIVNDLGELGVMVNGVAYFLYKGDNIVYEDAKHDDGSPMLYRMVGKREFGETCWPLKWIEAGRREDRYTQKLHYAPGLSFGKPEDGDWRPLPTQGAAPAASGGERGTCSRHCAETGQCTNTCAPIESGASVSERARELVTALYGDKAVFTRRDMTRALEQALTQQRGEAEAAARAERASDACESCGRRDPLYASDYRSALDTLADFNPGADEYTSAIDLLRQHTPLLHSTAGRVDWLALADELEAFKPRCELGALHGAGMAFAYKDVAKTIRAKLATTTPQPGAEALRWRAGAILGAAYRDAQDSDPSINFCTPEWRVALSAVEQALTESPGSEALRGGIRNVISRIINDGRDREWVIRELESLLARGGK